MSKNTVYQLLSLPTSIVPSHHRDDALEAISSTVHVDGSVSSFPIPEFKIGTLDALVQQAEELAKLEGVCQAVVGKVGDALKGVLINEEEQIRRMKTVNDSAYSRAASKGHMLICSRTCRPVPAYVSVEQGQVSCR
jgi:V-type H+-transporting ATPase subunit C